MNEYWYTEYDGIYYIYYGFSQITILDNETQCIEFIKKAYSAAQLRYSSVLPSYLTVLSQYLDLTPQSVINTLDSGLQIEYPTIVRQSGY